MKEHILSFLLYLYSLWLKLNVGCDYEIRNYYLKELLIFPHFNASRYISFFYLYSNCKFFFHWKSSFLFLSLEVLCFFFKILKMCVVNLCKRTSFILFWFILLP